MDYRTARLNLGEAACLAPTMAAQLYGARPADVLPAWRAAGIIFADPQGRPRIRWGDVLLWAQGELGQATLSCEALADPWAALPEWEG